MKIKVITPPTAEPLTLTELKGYLKIDSTIDDAVLTAFIKQAREWCEMQQNKKYVTQTLEAYLDKFPCGDIEFRGCSPVQSVEYIKYTDTNNVQHTLDSNIYELDNVDFLNAIKLKYSQIWPTTVLKTVNPIVIRFIAGYLPDGNNLVANIPETIKQAIVMQVKLLYSTYTEEEQRRIERVRNSLLGIERLIPT